MWEYLQILSLIIIGLVLLWFGFTFFVRQWAKIRLERASRVPKPENTGDPQICPICSSKLIRGDLVKTLAFPSITGGKDRLMHIKGCAYCIDGAVKRSCPICGVSMSITDILIARIFERPHRRAHVHIVGCNKCRRVGKL
jgi:hypothetical protein